MVVGVVWEADVDEVVGGPVPWGVFWVNLVWVFGFPPLLGREPGFVVLVALGLCFL